MNQCPRCFKFVPPYRGCPCDQAAGSTTVAEKAVTVACAGYWLVVLYFFLFIPVALVVGGFLNLVFG